MSKWKKTKECRRKVRHAYFDEATRELRRMKQRLGKRDFLCIYHCRLCKGWHIGNRISIEGAKTSLRTLEQKMSESRFKTRAPQRIQTAFHERRLQLTYYLLQRINEL